MALTAARANKSTAVGFNLKRLRFGGRSSPDRDEQAKGDAERLFVLAAQIVGVARLDEPAVFPLGRRPNLHIDQRHRAKGTGALAMAGRVESGGSNTGHDL